MQQVGGSAFDVAGHEFDQRLRHALFGQQQVEAQRDGQDGKQRAQQLGGFQRHGIEIAQSQFAMDEDFDQQRVGEPDGRRFGGGEPAGVDAAQNDHRQQRRRAAEGQSPARTP